MIKTEIIMKNGKENIRTHSDSVYLIKKDGADDKTDAPEEEL